MEKLTALPKLALALPIKPIVAMLRKIIKEAAPQAAEVFAGRSVSFDYDGAFARIEASDRKVLLEFVNDASLDAPSFFSAAGPKCGIWCSPTSMM